jgi:hypothetical protein
MNVYFIFSIYSIQIDINIYSKKQNRNYLENQSDDIPYVKQMGGI